MVCKVEKKLYAQGLHVELRVLSKDDIGGIEENWNSFCISVSCFEIFAKTVQKRLD